MPIRPGLPLLSLMLAAAAPAAAQAPGQAPGQAPAQLVVQLWSFGFGPSPIHLAAGRPVTLTFVNRAGTGHDFTAPGFFQHATILSGAAPGGEVELRGHETKSVTLVPARGTYQAHCGHFMHKQLGMIDTIVVD